MIDPHPSASDLPPAPTNNVDDAAREVSFPVALPLFSARHHGETEPSVDVPPRDLDEKKYPTFLGAPARATDDER